jgi:cadmium resistance transport/sequestration family protein
MDSWANTLLVGITSFIATNLDDLAILMLFFVQTDRTFRHRHIVAGQYLGFFVLLLASLPGYWGGLILPKPWIGLLGLLPIWMGLNRLRCQATHPASEVQTVGTLPNPSQIPGLTSLLTLQTYQVAAITIVNGGDNIGIYVPLFASSSFPQLIAILLIFLGMVAVWCGLAVQLAKHSMIAIMLNRYGDRIIPFLLIGLGVYILIENRSVKLLRLSSI